MIEGEVVDREARVLSGYELKIEVRERGKVVIKRLS